jgi:hypothetical protein
VIVPVARNWVATGRPIRLTKVGTAGLQHNKLGSRLTTAATAPTGPPRRGPSPLARALRAIRRMACTCSVTTHARPAAKAAVNAA